MKIELKKNQIRHLLENMTDGYFLLNSKWQFTDINDQGRKIIAAPGELLGRNIWDVFPHSLGTDYQINYEKAIQTQEPVHFEIFSPRLSIWFEVKAIPLGDDGLAVFFDDITSRKIHEDQQAATAERLEMALEASQLGMWEWFMDRDQLKFSDHAFRIFDLPPELFRDNFFKDFPKSVHPEDLELTKNAVRTCIATRAPQMIEFRIVCQNQTVRWVQARGRTIHDPQTQQAIRMIGTVIDITARKNQQEELQQALTTAKSANELKSAFLANMSHEIRTPLGAILGFAEILAAPETVAEDRNQYVSIIERNGRILSRLIDDILDLSKVESGQLELETVSFSLRKTLDLILPNLQLTAGSKSLPIEVFVADGTPDTLTGDPTRLSQILLNLLQNAVKFTERGSVRLKVFEKSDFIHFDIIDTGIGMSPEQASRLFHAFRQADESITRRYGGTGLGLALSKKLSQLLGGDVQLLESQPGQGSRFQVQIPLQYKKPQLQAGVL